MTVLLPLGLEVYPEIDLLHHLRIVGVHVRPGVGFQSPGTPCQAEGEQ